MTKIKKMFDICIEICKREFPDRLWFEENLPYHCIRELYMRRAWYENGKLKFEGEHRDGKRKGIHRRWHKNGQLEFKGEFRDDKKKGIHRWWDENGQFESTYVGKDG